MFQYCYAENPYKYFVDEGTSSSFPVAWGRVDNGWIKFMFELKSAILPLIRSLQDFLEQDFENEPKCVQHARLKQSQSLHKNYRQLKNSSHLV